MLKHQNILAIIDPTTDRQLALQRALRIGERLDAAVHVYICCYSFVEVDHFLALKRVEIARHEAWIDAVIAAENQAAVKVTRQVEWHEDWREALSVVAGDSTFDLIVKSANEHSETGRLVMKTSDLTVLRTAKCPVLFVKSASAGAAERALISINPKVEDDPHQRLNDDLVEAARIIEKYNENVELHAVSAYTGSEPFTHPSELAKIVGVNEANAHCIAGDPDDVIVDCAATLKPDLVVVGTVSRSGISGLAKPNTAEKVLDRLDSDVLVVTAPA